MPSIIPGFEYDVFISYRQKDNKGGHWVTEFVNALKTEIESTFKENISVYFDENPFDGLLETHHVDKSLEEKLKCLVFIPILSQTYCDPKSFAWQNEFVAFNRLAKTDQFGRDIKLYNGNVACRILPVKIHELDQADQNLVQSELGGPLRAIDFIYKTPGVNRPLLTTDRKDDNLSKTQYHDQINKTANAIKEIVTSLQKPKFVEVKKTDRPIAIFTGKGRMTRNYFGLGILALAALLTLFWYQILNDNAGEPNKSIAVLPFVNISNDPDQDFFGEGIAEEIINVLVQKSELKIIARSSSFQFKGRNEDLREVGKKLGVDHIIEGSVRKEGDTVRITAQLIKVSDGSHLWSSTYNRTSASILRVQDEIAEAISKKLDFSLLKIPPQKSQFQSAQARSHYLLGKYFTERPTAVNFRKADSVFQLALDIEPSNAKIWAAVATVYALQDNNGFEKKMMLASQAAHKAITLDSNCADAQSVLGYINTTYWYKWNEAEANFKKALSLEPTNAMAKTRLGMLYSTLGKFELAMAQQRESIKYDPLNLFPYIWLAFNQLYTEQYDEAEKTIKKIEELDPEPEGWPYLLGVVYLFRDSPEKAIEKIKTDKRRDWRAFGLAQAYYSAGMTSESDEMLTEMIRDHGNSPLQIGEIYAFRGDADKAFEWLEKAFEDRVVDFIVLKRSPWLKKVVNDPRYKALLQKLNLPPD